MLELKEIFIKTEFIKLGQFLKYTNFINSGGEIKEFLNIKKIYCNGVLENRRGRKLYPNDKIQIDNMEYILIKG